MDVKSDRRIGIANVESLRTKLDIIVGLVRKKCCVPPFGVGWRFPLIQD